MFEEVLGNGDEEVAGEWEPLTLFTLVMETFSAFEYALDDLIIKGFEGHAMFDVVVTYSIEVLTGGVCLD